MPSSLQPQPSRGGLVDGTDVVAEDAADVVADAAPALGGVAGAAISVALRSISAAGFFCAPTSPPGLAGPLPGPSFLFVIADELHRGASGTVSLQPP